MSLAPLIKLLQLRSLGPELTIQSSGVNLQINKMIGVSRNFINEKGTIKFVLWSNIGLW